MEKDELLACVNAFKFGVISSQQQIVLVYQRRPSLALGLKLNCCPASNLTQLNRGGLTALEQ